MPSRTTQGPRRLRRARSYIVAGVAAALIVAVSVTSVLDRGPSVVERAYAAVSEPSLYHVVRSTTIDAPAWLDLSDAVPTRDVAMESWYSLDPPANHEVYYKVRNGHRTVHLEWAGGPDGTTVANTPAGKDFKWMEGKSATVERFDPTVIEHDPQHVIGPEFMVRSSRTVALFDAQTMYPIESINESDIEANGRRATVVMRTHYTTFETLPRTPENLAKLQIR
jgi:hypothetical protein